VHVPADVTDREIAREVTKIIHARFRHGRRRARDSIGRRALASDDGTTGSNQSGFRVPMRARIMTRQRLVHRRRRAVRARRATTATAIGVAMFAIFAMLFFPSFVSSHSVCPWDRESRTGRTVKSNGRSLELRRASSSFLDARLRCDMQAQACSNPTATSLTACNLRGDVGCTTVQSGALSYTHEVSETAGSTIASGAHIYGPFEAGFSAQQDSIISNWGCSPASLAYDTAGGLDLGVATAKVASVCGITLPRISGTEYVGIVGSCGGHTGDYHFHGGFECFESNSGTHSPKVGEAGDKYVYGRYEDYTAGKYPYLDACGGHFGTTPDSTTTPVYHYHIQRDAPFTLGCHGPNSANGLVTVAQCRALYSECSGSTSTFTINGTTVTYMRDCPCFDAQGKNYGTPTELPAIAQAANGVTSYDVSAWSCRSLNNGYDGCIPTLAELTATTPSTSSTISGLSRTSSRAVAALSLVLAVAGATLA